MKKYFNYKGLVVNSLGLPVSGRKEKISSRRKRVYYRHRCFVYNFKNNAPKDQVIVYDMPQKNRGEREWFMRHLKKFDYTLIQKGVWVGPSPLPRGFVNYVKSIGLGEYLKVFSLSRPYSRDDSNL